MRVFASSVNARFCTALVFVPLPFAVSPPSEHKPEVHVKPCFFHPPLHPVACTHGVLSLVCFPSFCGYRSLLLRARFFMQQNLFGKTHWQHRFSHGGTLRKCRAGRGARPLSCREPLHLVLKAKREKILPGFRTYKRFALIHFLLRKYAAHFFVKIEQVSIQSDHIHLLIRTTRRSNYQNFFRVFAGQIAQRFEKEGLLTVTKQPLPKKGGTPAHAKVTGTPRVTGSVGTTGSKTSASSTPTCPPPASPKGLWRHRPFSRVVRGWRAYKIVRDYIQLNEKEALGQIPYRKKRLTGLSNSEWQILWR